VKYLYIFWSEYNIQNVSSVAPALRVRVAAILFVLFIGNSIIWRWIYVQCYDVATNRGNRHAVHKRWNLNKTSVSSLID